MKKFVRRAVRNVLAWAVVEIDGSNQGTTPWQQVRAFGQAARSVQWYPYGFFAVAPAGTLSVRATLADQTDAHVHFPGSPTQRPDGVSGECGIYHPETGSWVIFRADGSIEVSAAKDLRAAVAGALSADVVGNASVTAGGTLAATATGALTATSAVSATVTAPTISLAGNVGITGHLDQDGANIGFRGSAPIAKPVINGSKSGGTAQNQLLAALHAMGIIDDQT